MKRTIKRTEVTIETVEITTIRRTGQETDKGEELRNEVIHPPLMLSRTAEPAEQIRQNEIEENKENDKTR